MRTTSRHPVSFCAERGFFAIVEKFEKEAAEMNKRSFKYAWVSVHLTWKLFGFEV
jgi:Elongation factor Tu GTP binding domain